MIQIQSHFLSITSDRQELQNHKDKETQKTCSQVIIYLTLSYIMGKVGYDASCELPFSTILLRFNEYEEYENGVGIKGRLLDIGK